MNTGLRPGNGQKLAVAQVARELGYAQITANPTGFTTTPGDIAGLALTVFVGLRPILLDFFAPTTVIDSGAAARCVVTINEGATVFGRGETAAASTVIVSGQINSRIRLAPTPGWHTYKCVGLTNAGTAHIVCDPTYPCFFSITEL